MKYQKVKYKLINNDTGEELELSGDKIDNPEKPAPKGWDENERTFKRAPKTMGAFTEFSNNLIYTKQGAEFNRRAYFFKDIEARVSLEEYRAYTNKDGYYLNEPTGQHDFSDYESDKLTVKVPFKTGGLNALIQSQLKEKFELERLESINGKEIDPIDKIDVAVTGRSIFLLSELESSEERTSTFTNTTPFRAPLLDIVSNNDAENINPTLGDDFVSYNNTPSLGNSFTLLLGANQHFYLGADRDKTVTFDFNIKLQHDRAFGTHLLQAYLVRTNDLNVATEITVLYNSGTSTDSQWDFTASATVDLLTDDNLALVFDSQLFPTGSTGSEHALIYKQIQVIAKEDSVFPPSQTKAVFIKDAFEKLMQIITGEKGRFYSDFYTNGDFSKTAIALGLWIRGFGEENIEISLSDLLDACSAIHNTSYTIETINGVETLVVEEMKYFFQNQTAIKLPFQVNKLERKAAKEFAHSSGLFGYKDPPEDNKYEEVMGLDEYNVRTGYTFPITRTDTTYKKVSPFRADATAKELARRKPKLNYPEEDTRYDKSIHLFDLKEGLGMAYEERLWQDDYEIEPTGIYAPENATNLRLTPFRNSERHQWFYGSALTKFQDESVRFSNSDGNKDLITKKADEVERPENGNLLISELERPRFVNQWITFEHEVDFDLNQQIYSKTGVNGRDIPNYFFKVEFINELGKKEYGYLFELKPNKQGTWKLLKAL